MLFPNDTDRNQNAAEHFRSISVSMCYSALSGLRMVSEWFPNDLRVFDQHLSNTRKPFGAKVLEFSKLSRRSVKPRRPESEQPLGKDQ